MHLTASHVIHQQASETTSVSRLITSTLPANKQQQTITTKYQRHFKYSI